MPTFTWHDLIVTVGEMSRTAALECARDINPYVGLYRDDAALLQELETLSVIHSPSAIRAAGETLSTTAGKRIFTVNGEQLEIELPLTREGFNKLPYSLTMAWINAAVNANEWLVDDVKKAYSRATMTTSASPSGNAPSSEPTATPQTTKTTGE